MEHSQTRSRYRSLPKMFTRLSLSAPCTQLTTAAPAYILQLALLPLLLKQLFTPQIVPTIHPCRQGQQLFRSAHESGFDQFPPRSHFKTQPCFCLVILSPRLLNNFVQALICFTLSILLFYNTCLWQGTTAVKPLICRKGDSGQQQGKLPPIAWILILPWRVCCCCCTLVKNSGQQLTAFQHRWTPGICSQKLLLKPFIGMSSVCNSCSNSAFQQLLLHITYIS